MAGAVPGGVAMKRFEYKAVDMLSRYPDKADLHYELDCHGDDGWELCAIEYGFWIFKREVSA